MGSWDVSADEAPDLGTLSSWVSSNWSLVASLHLKRLTDVMILLVFDNAKDAERV